MREVSRVEWDQLAIGAATAPLGFVAGIGAGIGAGAVFGRSLSSGPTNLLVGVLVALAIPVVAAVHAYATRRPWRGHGALLALGALVVGSILVLIALGQAMASIAM